MLPPHVDAAWLRRFRSRLLAWYRREGRSLPWRETRDPYAILVSELMLQQTQAATVIPYYGRFLARYPTARSLAAATIDDVLKAWEGLGYYRRARLLHAAALKIVGEHGGEFPQRFEQIADLPGVGRYTAGAIASFAFDQPRPIVEANTQRLHARLLKLQTPIQNSEAKNQLWALAEAILSRKHAAEINHAVMDLGAMICKPRSPTCLICPLRPLCPTQQAGLQDRIPVVAKRRTPVEMAETVVAIFGPEGRLWLQRRPEGTWWAGMWDLPRLAAPNGDAAAVQAVSEQLQCDLRTRAVGPIFRYGVTHHKIAAKLLICDATPSILVPNGVAEKSSVFSSNCQDVENCGEPSQLESVHEATRTHGELWRLTDAQERSRIAMTRSARVICEYLREQGFVS